MKIERQNKISTEFGTVRIGANGYYYICSTKEGNYRELLHRLIYKKHYGTIPNNMIVHHKNHNKLDNRISNLELVSREEHASLHHTGKKRPEETKNKIGNKHMYKLPVIRKDYQNTWVCVSKFRDGDKRKNKRISSKSLTNCIIKVDEFLQSEQNNLGLEGKIIAIDIEEDL